MPPSCEVLTAWLKANEKREIRIHHEKTRQPLPVGACKIGGCPDLPADFVWPRYDCLWRGSDSGFGLRSRAPRLLRRLFGREEKEHASRDVPLTFMAQFDLAETAAFDAAGLLPRAGHLAFFYDYCNLPWGMPEGEGCARVFHFPPEAALRRVAPPEDLPEGCRLPEQRLSFSDEVSPPSPAQLPDKLYDEDFIDEMSEGTLDGEDSFKLLGRPVEIQGAMEEECQMLSMGLDWNSYERATPSQKEAVKTGVADWMLLLQLGSIFDRERKEYDMLFGDAGAIYFWIRRQDLAARNFDDVQLIMQCY